MKCLDDYDADDPTKNIGLLEVDINEFGCALFNVFDSLANVIDF
jgi:hypothetical protein